jgi:hypothetical protein
MRRNAEIPARRRSAIAALTALLIMSAVFAVEASARPVALGATHSRLVSSELFDSRATGPAVLPDRAVLGARGRRSRGAWGARAW